MSTGDFAAALEESFGSDVGGSASSIGRRIGNLGRRVPGLPGRDLSGSAFVYMWADGVHFRIQLNEGRLCCLVLAGVTAESSKEPLACVDGYRESAD